MMRKQILQVAFLVGAASSLALANQSGTSTAQFLQIGRGARPSGMGSAFTAVANDSRAVVYNPAGLGQMTRTEFDFDYLSYIEDMKVNSVAGGIPVDKWNGTFGFDITSVDMGTIERYDSLGVAQSGNTDLQGYSGTFSYGQAIGSRLSLGLGAKYVKQDLAGSSGSTWAGDLGGLFFIVPDKLSIGVSLLNIGAQLKTGTVSEDLPQTLRGGLAYYVLPELVLDVDAYKANDSDAQFNVGGEYVYRSMFALRAGYQDNQEAGGGLSAGVGYIWRPSATQDGSFLNIKTPVQSRRGMEVRFDYAYVDYGDFKGTNRLGVSVSF